MPSYLIDGYNLLYAMGVLHGRTGNYSIARPSSTSSASSSGRTGSGPGGLEKARLRLLGLLHGTFRDDSNRVTVIFDAANPPPDAVEVMDHHGIQVRFAIRQEQADDLIEELIRHDSAPRRLHVVSDDHRIQQAAHRRHCLVLSCGDFLNWLERQRRQQPASQPPPAVKPEGVSREETQYWLHEFADLENDPDWKEIFDPFDFDREK